MELTPLVWPIFKSVWWVIPGLILIAFLKSARFKGAAGEFVVKHVTNLNLTKDIYHPLHDVTVPTPDGSTQIDHVYVSVHGVFVVETKNMKGWIFGSEHQAHWTQKIYRKTFKFQNPLRQNYKHVKALEALLGIPSNLVHSIVVFSSDCTFKTDMPVNVMKAGQLAGYIKRFEEEVLSEADVDRALEEIATVRFANTRQTRRQHITRLKSRRDLQSEQICPKCGSDMVVRTAKTGRYAGSNFWGCSAYPKCRAIRRT